jgi:hypothetical protein
VLLGVCGCTRTGRDPECRLLMTEMRKLGTKLASTRRVTSSDAATARSVASALDAYAKSAKSIGETLAEANYTLPELAKLSADASGVASSLATAATKMVRAAEQTKGFEQARNVARIQRSLAEVAVANLNRDCSSGSVKCAGLSEVLLRRPSFPDASVDSEAAATWTAKSNAWLDELAAVAVANDELTHQISNLVQTSKAFSSALATLAPGNDRAQELVAATAEFDAQIARMQQVATAAEAFCKQQ